MVTLTCILKFEYSIVYKRIVVLTNQDGINKSGMVFRTKMITINSPQLVDKKYSILLVSSLIVFLKDLPSLYSLTLFY